MSGYASIVITKGHGYLEVKTGNALTELANPESDNSWKFARKYDNDGSIVASGWVPYYCLEQSMASSSAPSSSTEVPSFSSHAAACEAKEADRPGKEILALFRERGLPEAVAEQLTDPCGECAYRDLVTFARLVTFEDLIGAGLQRAPVRDYQHVLHTKAKRWVARAHGGAATVKARWVARAHGGAATVKARAHGGTEDPTHPPTPPRPAAAGLPLPPAAGWLGH